MMHYISLLEAQNRDLRAQGVRLQEYITTLEVLFPQLMSELRTAMPDACSEGEDPAQRGEHERDKKSSVDDRKIV